jgi:hypothetical protein
MIAFLNVYDIERLHGVTWGELVELEPELARLWWQARQAGAACRRWPDMAWVFALFRQDLTALIGPAGKHRQHAILGTLAAFDVAYWRLFDAVARSMILQVEKGTDSLLGPNRTAAALQPGRTVALIREPQERHTPTGDALHLVQTAQTPIAYP